APDGHATEDGSASLAVSRPASASEGQGRDRGLAGVGDGGTNLFGRAPERIVEQVRIALRRVDIAVAKQRADQRQAMPGANERARVGVAQVVNSQAGDARGLAQPLPCPVNVYNVPALARA